MDIFERDVPPTHPGIVLAEALAAMKLKIMPAAELLGTSRQTLHKILKGTAAVTPAMALKLGTLCGNGPNLWINMQTNHDLWHESRRMGREIDGIRKKAAAL